MRSTFKDSELPDLIKELESIAHGSETYTFLRKIMSPQEGKLVLECGFDYGSLGLAYSMRGCEVILIDPNPERVGNARKLRGALNSLQGFPLPVMIRVANIDRIHLSPNFFNLVFNVGVIQRFSDKARRQRIIDQMAKVSSDYVVVIGDNDPKTFEPDELETLLKKAGLKHVGVEPITPGKLSGSSLVAGYGRIIE